MLPSREQVVHDLTMACVSGMVMSRVIQESKDDPDNIGISYNAGDLAIDAVIAYENAYNTIDASIAIEDK